MEKSVQIVIEAGKNQELRFVRNNTIQAASLFPNFQVDESNIKNRILAPTRDYGHLYDASLGERLANRDKAVPTNAEWSKRFGTWVEQMSGRADKFEANKQLEPVIGEILNTLGVQGQSYEFLITEYSNNRENMNAFITKISHLPDLENKLPIVQEMCRWLYGQEMVPKIIAQVVDLEGRINTTNGETPKLDTLVQEVTDGSKTPTPETAEMLKQAGEFAQAGASAPKGDGTEGMADLTHAKNEKKSLGEDAEVIKKATHTGDEQTVHGEETFVGGDCYGTWAELNPPPSKDLLQQRGWMYTIADTATQGGKPKATLAFKKAFYKHYYDPNVSFGSPQEYAKDAFEKALLDVKRDLDVAPSCTFAYGLIQQGADGQKKAYVGNIGSDRTFAADATTNTFNALTQPHDKVEVTRKNTGEKVKATIMAGDYGRNDDELANADTALHQAEIPITGNMRLLLMTDGFQGNPVSLEKLTDMMTADDCLCLKIDPSKLKLS